MASKHANGPRLPRGPSYLGILNITPDSFSDGGRFLDPTLAVAQARSLAEQGATMIDIGAESTRPGAAPIPVAEEWSRLEPVLRALRAELPELPLSLDTRHAAVAGKGLALGVAVVNDVTGFSNPAMLSLAREGRFGLIAMRSRRRGALLSMPEYGGEGETDDGRALRELARIRDRLLDGGIHRDRILLDPGFGFGTTYAEDTALWAGLASLPARLDWPVEGFCLGVSRKRFLAWRAGTPELPADQRDGLTGAAHAEAAALGYRVFRTHAIPA